MHLYQATITRGQCFTIISQYELALVKFLAPRCYMLLFLFRNILHPIFKEPFDSRNISAAMTTIHLNPHVEAERKRSGCIVFLMD